MRRLTLLLAMTAALPAAAQDLTTSTTLLTHFATRCGQIAADPTTAVSGIAGASARIAGDRSLITHKEPAGPSGEIAFRQMQFADGKSSDCALTITGFGAAQYDDLGTLIAQNGATLFGTQVKVYGNNTPGNTVQMIATPGYPPAASLTQVQTRDRLELLLSLASGPASAAQPAPAVEPVQPAPAPQPDQNAALAPQPQVLEITPAPGIAPEALALELAPPSPEQQAKMDIIGQGLTACLIAANDPLALAPSLQEVGFAFDRMDGDTGFLLTKDGVSARISASPTDGFCTLIAEDLPLAYGIQAADATAAKTAVGTATNIEDKGCKAVSMTAPAAPVTMNYINPGYPIACESPKGTAISLVLQ